jgi:hypothetical protein
MADVCRIARQALFNRISDQTLGFNATYAAVQPGYLDFFSGDPVDPIVIDFSAGSVNFNFGRVPPDLIEETSAFTYPFLTISAERIQPWGTGNRVHYQQFSGAIQGFVEVHVSWEQEEVRDFETLPDAVIDAMFQCVQAPSMSQPNVANSWNTLNFRYDLSAQKTPVLALGQGWRRTILFACSFEAMIA